MTTDQYVTVIDGVELVSTEGMGLLCGVSAEDARTEYLEQQKVHPGYFVIPKAWKRGAKELQAKHGTRNFLELIARIKADRGAA